MDTLPFATVSKKIKYMWINLTKEVKDLCIDLKPLKKMLRKTLENGKSPCSWIHRINIVEIGHFKKKLFTDSRQPQSKSPSRSSQK